MEDFMVFLALVAVVLGIIVIVKVCQTAERTGRIISMLAERWGTDTPYNLRLYLNSITDRNEGLKMLNASFLKELGGKVKAGGAAYTEEAFRKDKYALAEKYENFYRMIGESVPAQLSLMSLDTARWVFA